ncbi:MAG: shikimate dehydrogenase [Bacteroidota bacterium]
MPVNGRIFGLIGFPLSHSFSKQYFTEKFIRENIPGCSYELFSMESIESFPQLVASRKGLSGLNVTIPHKLRVMSFLDEISEEAREIGAVNVIQFKNGKLKGYNSDAYGFEVSLRELLSQGNLQGADIQAFILGTGGASLAVKYVLKKLNVAYQFVSRTRTNDNITYHEITPELLGSHRLVINCTPLGTYPNEDTFPDLPYEAVTDHHFFYDLVYNPALTVFLKKAQAKGSAVMNGLPMLHLQAEKSWEIWNQ